MKNNDKHKIRLEEMPKETPFTVPEGYFEGFSAQLDARLQKENASKIPVESHLWRGVRSMLGIAAGFAFFVILSFTLIQYILNKNDVDTSRKIASKDSIRQEAFLNGQGNEVITENINEDEVLNETYYTDFMIDYLLSEGIDIQLITEEL